MAASSPARIVQKYLIDQGVVGGPEAANADWPSSVAVMPSDGDNRAAFMDTGGRNDARGPRSMNDGKRIVHEQVQVMLRSSDYDAGWSKGEAVQDKFDSLGGPGGRVGVHVDGNYYTLTAVHVTIPLTPLGRDQDTLRSLFVINAEVEYQ